ncbi:MAG: hypothetical protein LBQ73_08095 [Tannerellaceae bacterium]|jgi:hypothetical protein|nr:hypothetical protein [Tannerellaceae bacterium]
MGFIREPEGIDFVINSEPLTDKDRAEISQYIHDYKAKNTLIAHDDGNAGFIDKIQCAGVEI